MAEDADPSDFQDDPAAAADVPVEWIAEILENRDVLESLEMLESMEMLEPRESFSPHHFE